MNSLCPIHHYRPRNFPLPHYFSLQHNSFEALESSPHKWQHHLIYPEKSSLHLHQKNYFQFQRWS